VPAFEAFKSGQLDYWPENSAKAWATAYDFDAVKRGLVKLEKLPTKNVAYMQSFAFNLRRPQFQDPRVRRAFNLAFDSSGPTRTCSTTSTRGLAATSTIPS
jgi:microcin C transport system substrate-binding protein